MQETSNHRICRLIRNFLQDETSALLFRHAMNEPTPQNLKKVEERFQLFYKEIQFISYVSSLIHYHAIAYDKRIRADASRCPLRLDASIGGEEGDGTLLEIVAGREENDVYNDTFTSLNEISEQKTLYNALRLLTDKERYVLEQVYLHNFSDTEIARLLGISQQTVSKTRNKALAKLRMSMKEGQRLCQSTRTNQA